MNRWQEMVTEFTRDVAEQDVPSKPSIRAYPRVLRARLVMEEAIEFVEASGLNFAVERAGQGHVSGQGEAGRWGFTENGVENWAGMIDAIVDTIYVAIGAAVQMGVDLDPFFEAVHAANMTKRGGPTDLNGKKLKPLGWRPPDIEGVLRKMRGE